MENKCPKCKYRWSNTAVHTDAVAQLVWKAWEEVRDSRQTLDSERGCALISHAVNTALESANREIESLKLRAADSSRRLTSLRDALIDKLDEDHASLLKAIKSSKPARKRSSTKQRSKPVKLEKTSESEVPSE